MKIFSNRRKNAVKNFFCSIYGLLSIEFCSLKKCDQIAYRASKSKVSKIPEDFEKGELGIIDIFEKYQNIKNF